MTSVIGAGVVLLQSSSIAGSDSKSLAVLKPWLGEWRGTILQADSPLHSWTLAIRLKEQDEKFVGSYVELSLKCEGTLTLTFGGSSKLDLVERVIAQPPTGTPWFCGGGSIQLERTGTNRALYIWDGGVAHGVIRR
jgi:hypothetical protein